MTARQRTTQLVKDSAYVLPRNGETDNFRIHNLPFKSECSGKLEKLIYGVCGISQVGNNLYIVTNFFLAEQQK